jgi:hypothetical protein
MQKIKSLIVSLLALTMLITPVLVAVPAYAFDIAGNVCQGTNGVISAGSGDAAACNQGGNLGTLNTTLTNIINIFSGIVGVIAVLMIIVGGLRYITSGGDTNKVSGAKTTIIYALVGLVVVAMAQLIVHFVLTQASTLTQ